MNDERRTCDSWAERVSLLAADALPADDEPDVRRHLAECPTCRQRFEQLAGLAGRLHAARPAAADFDFAGIVGRAMAQVVDESVETSPLGTPKGSPIGAPTAATRRDEASDRSWRGLLVVAAVAACVTAAVIFGRWSGRDPRRPDRIEPNVPTAGIDSPSTPVESVRVARGETGREMPTLLELRRAAAESDEALDRLFAQRSFAPSAESFSSQSLSSPSIWQESL